jgi:hypothetical protein
MEQDRILNYFSLLKKREIIGKSYLFVGDDFSLVKKIIKLINCDENEGYFCDNCLNCSKIDKLNHPDLFLAEPKTLSITIEDIKEAQQFLRLKGFSISRKTVIIKAAETIGEAAANAFLKTLEEPPRNSLIIICTSKLEGLLPTIVSRCRKISLPFNEQDIPLAPLRLVPDFLKGEKLAFKDRNDFKNFLWALIVALRDYMVEGFVPEDNRLLKSGNCEIIFRFLENFKYHSPAKVSDTLRDILKIYGAYSTINENLALNLIRTKIDYI